MGKVSTLPFLEAESRFQVIGPYVCRLSIRAVEIEEEKMQITDDLEERIAIIMEGCKVSEAEAIAIIERKDFSGEVNRLRKLADIQNSKRRKYALRKTE